MRTELLAATTPDFRSSPAAPASAPAEADVRPLSRSEALHVLQRRSHASVLDPNAAGALWQRLRYAMDESALFARADRQTDPRPTRVEVLVNDLSDPSAWRVARVYGTRTLLVAGGEHDAHERWRGALQLLRAGDPSLRHADAALAGVALYRIALEVVSGLEQQLVPADL